MTSSTTPRHPHSPPHVEGLVARARGRRAARARAFVVMCCVLAVGISACSFDVPPEVGLDVMDDGLVDLGGLPDEGGATSPDLDAMPSDGIDPLDLGGDAGDAGADMPRGDMGQGADMKEELDAAGDMTSDQGPEDMPDMMVTPGNPGDPCRVDNDCATGSLCRVIQGVAFCAVSCSAGTCQGDFGCVEGVCAPSDFCAPDGVTGPGCETCDRCADVASCNEIIDGTGQTIYQCVCPDGYMGDGLTCADINECQTGAAMCDPNATCVNTTGSFDCLCNAGFMGDGQSCTPIPSACDMCSPQASCVMDAQGMEQCQCDAGYVGNGVTCQDLDECASGQAQCEANEECVNTTGSYRCDCAPGYVEDNGSCVDFDECGTDPCDPLATCTNLSGGFQCNCPAGVAGNGLTCIPYASCAEIITAFPQSPSGLYTIRTANGTQLDVYCDMDSDNGAGYTLYRVDDPASLKATQQAYASACSALGMEIVTPRSQEHMEAILAWNAGSPPNIVNVFPSQDFEQDIQSWAGSCGGQACSFFLNGRENTRCRTPEQQSGGVYTTWSGGKPARDCYEYLEDSAVPLNTGAFQIDPDGPGGSQAPFFALCGMNLDGGGWTLATSASDDGQDTWTWNNRTLLTTNTSTVGSLATSNRDYKNPAVHTMPMKDLAFVHYPSQQWASYHGVSNGQTVSDLLENTSAPQCDPNGGFPMTHGTIVASAGLCSTNLYIHPGDFDNGSSAIIDGPTRCNTYRDFGSPRDESTWGFAWSQSRDHVCPFDDPAYSSFGINQWIKDEEAFGVGFGAALGLNAQPFGVGINYLYMLLRGEKPAQPSGENTTLQRIVLEAPPSGDAGPACTYGSWDDRGNQVVEQGWVICGINE